MKCVLILAFTALLGGCAIAPGGYGDGERGYNRGNGSSDRYPYREYNDGYHHNYS